MHILILQVIYDGDIYQFIITISTIHLTPNQNYGII